ncbi:hypothetical protein LUZ63_008553 [Rhynchospora breviuscula]|uniref:Uncharacterized protein n=1 Tax=Rhynchospora breviuscula TaxID=2022672 RepID=A0A9Q0CTV8_9POAL|nr:hypothetical protein LUZ63_008553 [Rhynchospora breviuscula]
MEHHQSKPLLSVSDDCIDDNKVESWKPYEYHPQAPTGEQVRLPSNFSQPLGDRFDCYPPPSNHAIPSPDPPPLPFSHAISPFQVAAPKGYGYQGGYNDHQCCDPSRLINSSVLDEVEVRQLLVDHVGHRCCWGSGPARKWQITSIENCSAYVGLLETFIEERETVIEREPYMGGEIDKTHKGSQCGIWELDVKSDFPQLFIPEKEIRIRIPHTEVIHKCNDCNGRGETACSFCHGMDPMTQCPECFGRGVVADQDGSDTVCTMCLGKGTMSCASCNSRGTMTCNTCNGCGSLLTRSVAVVKWKTLYTKKVSTSSKAASVPDEVFHKARGKQLYNMQSYQCTPAFFPNFDELNNLSSEVIARRAPVPPSARVISERHIISNVPVTRVIMAHRNRSFSFYILGYDWDIFVRDYPSRFCWSLCCCFEWLNL